MGAMKGGDFIAESLIANDIPYIFGICGHGNVGMLDALYDRQESIQLISPRHEQTAGHMADAYYRVAHKPVATLTSTGPGSANMPMSLACAQADSSAFLAITANVPTSQWNRAPFQETYHHHEADFPSVVRPYVKRSFQPTRPEMLPVAMRHAHRLMTTGRPGPVNLDVPYNLFQEEMPEEHQQVSRPKESRMGASPEDVRRTAEMLMGADRPALFVGHGVTLSEAGPELTELVERFRIPVLMSPNGMGTISASHSLNLGMVGRNGTWPANQAGRMCDLLLAVGARFDDRSASSWIPGYSWNIPPSRLVHVDVDPSEVGRNYEPEIGVIADAQTFLRQLLAELDGCDRAVASNAWQQQVQVWADEWNSHVAPNFHLDTDPIRPERVVAEVQKVLPPEGILVCDSGAHHNWFMQFWNAERPQRMLNTWGFAAMGFGVSGVLGAKLAAPEVPAVAVVGDGGFTMTPHVLATAVEYNIPAIWVVWNNFSWSAIRHLQLGQFQGREIGTSFHSGGKPYSPDFAAMARSYGVEGVTVTTADELGQALEHAIATNRPFLIDAHVDGEVSPPSVGTWQLPPLPHPEPSFGGPWTP